MCPLFGPNPPKCVHVSGQCVQFGGRCVHFSGRCVHCQAALWPYGRCVPAHLPEPARAISRRRAVPVAVPCRGPDCRAGRRIAAGGLSETFCAAFARSTSSSQPRSLPTHGQAGVRQVSGDVFTSRPTCVHVPARIRPNVFTFRANVFTTYKWQGDLGTTEERTACGYGRVNSTAEGAGLRLVPATETPRAEEGRSETGPYRRATHDRAAHDRAAPATGRDPSSGAGAFV